MSRRPAFTVIIPTYDRPDLLRDAVESVRAQTVEDWECLVIDDCGTVELPEPDDPRVRIHRRAVNGGAAAALNTGAALARGAFLTMLADDDLWVPTRLELALEGLDAAPLAMCWSQYLGEPRTTSGRHLSGDVSDSILDTTIPSMGAIAVRRDRWLPLRPTYRTCEDVDWWLRTAQVTPVHTVPQVAHLVRRHDGPRHLSGAAQRHLDCRRLIDDHRTWFESHPVALAYRLRRVAHYACLLGRHAEAVRHLARSMRIHPTARTAKQLALAGCRRPAQQHA